MQRRYIVDFVVKFQCTTSVDNRKRSVENPIKKKGNIKLYVKGVNRHGLLIFFHDY